MGCYSANIFNMNLYVCMLTIGGREITSFNHYIFDCSSGDACSIMTSILAIHVILRSQKPCNFAWLTAESFPERSITVARIILNTGISIDDSCDGSFGSICFAAVGIDTGILERRLLWFQCFVCGKISFSLLCDLAEIKY